jgi:hypothetical protein
MPCPEVCSAHARLFPRVFFLVVVTWLPDVTESHFIPSGFPWVCACTTGNCATPVVTEGHLIPSGFPWVCACTTGNCATPVVTEDHVTPSEVSLGCSLRLPRPIFSMVTGTSPGFLPLLFSYIASQYVITNYPDRWRYYLVTW